jgi:hypothetical protein
VPPLEKQAFEELLQKGCGKCGRNYLKARALVRGSIEILDGDPVSAVTWTYESLAERVYRVECAECNTFLFERDECPLCNARGMLGRALEAQNGIAPPRQCPRCEYAELTLTVELRLRAETILGRISRRVAEAEAHEPGFHIVEARCRSCEEVVAAAGDARCVACGRSSLMRRLR